MLNKLYITALTDSRASGFVSHGSPENDPEVPLKAWKPIKIQTGIKVTGPANGIRDIESYLSINP